MEDMKYLKSQNKSFKYLLSRFLVFSTTIPMFVFGIISLSISYNVLRNELLESNEREVNLIVKSSIDYLNQAERILFSILLLYDEIGSDDPSLGYIKNVITESHNFIIGIQVSDMNGIVKSIYPYDSLITGSDISGYDYYKNTIGLTGYYWSPSFMSEIRDYPVVSLSSSTGKHIITMFLSLEDIGNLSSYSESIWGNIITITDQNGVFISHPENVRVRLRQRDLTFNYFKNKWDEKKIVEEVEINGSKYLSSIYFLPGINWKIALNMPLSELYTPGKYLGFWLMVLSISFITMVLLYGSKISKLVIESLSTVIKSTKKIALGNYNFPTPYVRYSELQILLDSFTKMVNKIKSREDDLKRAHKELELHKENLEIMVEERTEELNKTISNLKLTQKQLVESEKMASLGELVAGISHEINTPLGIIVTSASHLEDEIKIISKKIEKNKLTKQGLLDFNKSIIESLELILSNSRRSSELIKSFKQVSADQTSDIRRKFKIKNYLQEIIHSLKPQFYDKDITIELLINDEIIIDSYPGAFAQIITNLVLNSIIHGFDDRGHGSIKVEIEKKKEKCILTYIDNGKGMDNESKTKLFEPFYTTKRGRGGTGLGMHIVYNVVTQKLKGTIICKTSPGNGVEFDIELPNLF